MTYTFRDLDGRKRKQKAMRHKPRRIVAKLGSTMDYREQLPIEADKTRWWLQDQNCWRSSDLTMTIEMREDNGDIIKSYSFYPIFDDPNKPAGQRQELAWLGFDGGVYIMTDIGLLPIDPNIPELGDTVECLVEKLRLTRGE
jgi:hypothetical protein